MSNFLKDSFIIKCYTGKGHATDRGNYKDFKLLEHVMKVLECVLESLIRSKVDINNIQFGYLVPRILVILFCPLVGYEQVGNW